MRIRAGVAAMVVLITALGYLLFPAHTWLQQDTQIYVPILEHFHDPGVLAKDPVATRHHLSFTIYDEVALAARWLSGASFHTVLAADQILFRGLAILGVYLIATGLGLPRRLALLTAGLYAVGATVMGPAVLTVEYEPKPRGSAVGMVLLATGLATHRNYVWASVAASVAFLWHPPTTYPFWLVWIAVMAHEIRRGGNRKIWRTLIPPVAAALALLVCSRFQIGGTGPQAWFTRLTPELERLQRYRTPYNWVSDWIAVWAPHYLLLAAVAVLAIRRLQVPSPRRILLAGLPLVGLLSVPFSYLTYDVGQWALMAKFQPARALLWVPAMAVILAAAACLEAARKKRLLEPLLWGWIAFAIPMEHNVWDLLLPSLGEPLIARRFLLAAGLGALLSLTGWLTEQRRAQWVAWAAVLVLPFVLIPGFGKVVTERNMHSAELDQLCTWARRHTPRDTVFLFPDVGLGRQPGIFRATALRAVYVDWKSGGQVNMVPGFARQWWERYQATMLTPLDVDHLDRYAARGIDYLILSPQHQLADRAPVFANTRYRVYKLPRH